MNKNVKYKSDVDISKNKFILINTNHLIERLIVNDADLNAIQRKYCIFDFKEAVSMEFVKLIAEQNTSLAKDIFLPYHLWITDMMIISALIQSIIHYDWKHVLLQGFNEQ